jgi:hypothetical protein
MPPAFIMCKDGSSFASLNQQRGQALIYGLFVLVAGLAAFFFMFNTGQLVREKTKLVNTADAVAYAASVMDARTLNYMAYTNRAMLANTVAIAQLVSVSSWVQYANALGTWGTTSGDMTRYAVFYPSFQAARQSTDVLNDDLVDRIKQLALQSDRIIQYGLVTAQQQAYRGLMETRREVIEEVAKANYRDDGAVSAEQLGSSEFNDAVHHHADSERSRFGDVAKAAAYQDRFLPRRSWSIPASFPRCGPGYLDLLERRGGTELVGLDHWQAMDTMSDWEWIWIYFSGCTPVEWPQGAGLQAAADNQGTDIDPTHYDYSLLTNPGASLIAMSGSSDSWNYSGIPNFYDLSDAGRSKPNIRSAVRVKRTIDQTRTSEGRSSVAPTPRLNAYKAAPADSNALIAVSAAETYFERPDTDERCEDGSLAHRDNCFGRKSGRPTETASLFNPYWQVRLISAREYADMRLMEARTKP